MVAIEESPRPAAGVRGRFAANWRDITGQKAEDEAKAKTLRQRIAKAKYLLSKAMEQKQLEVAIEAAEELLSCGQPPTNELLNRLLCAASDCPGVERFSKVVGTCCRCDIKLTVMEYASLVGRLLARDAPHAQVRVALNFGISKGGEPLDLIPADANRESDLQHCFAGAEGIDIGELSDEEDIAAARSKRTDGKKDNKRYDPWSSAPKALLFTGSIGSKVNGEYKKCKKGAEETAGSRAPVYKKADGAKNAIFAYYFQPMPIVRKEKKEPAEDGEEPWEAGWYLGSEVGGGGMTYAYTPSRSADSPPQMATWQVFDPSGGTREAKAGFRAPNTLPRSKSQVVSWDEAWAELGQINMQSVIGRVEDTEVEPECVKYFTHFFVLLHLEVLAEVAGYRGRFGFRKAHELADFGLALLDTWVERVDKWRDESKRMPLPGWPDEGSQKVTFRLPPKIKEDRFGFKRGENVLISHGDPLTSRVAEGTVMGVDLNLKELTVNINGRMDELDLATSLFRLDCFANRTTFERQLTALLQFITMKRTKMQEMLIAAGVGKVDLAVLGGDGFADPGKSAKPAPKETKEKEEEESKAEETEPASKKPKKQEEEVAPEAKEAEQAAKRPKEDEAEEEVVSAVKEAEPAAKRPKQDEEQKEDKLQADEKEPKEEKLQADEKEPALEPAAEAPAKQEELQEVPVEDDKEAKKPPQEEAELAPAKPEAGEAPAGAQEEEKEVKKAAEEAAEAPAKQAGEAPASAPEEDNEAKKAAEEAAEAPAKQAGEELLALVFEPGKLGLKGDFRTGVVVEVVSAGQGEAKGVQPGWVMCEIDGEQYEEKLLRERITGEKPYTIGFSRGVLVPIPPEVTVDIVEVIFEPGRMGLKGDFSTGVLTEVIEGGQAATKGVKPDWVICTVDGQPYQQELLRGRITGEVPFALGFRPQVQESPAVGGDGNAPPQEEEAEGVAQQPEEEAPPAVPEPTQAVSAPPPAKPDDLDEDERIKRATLALANEDAEGIDEDKLESTKHLVTVTPNLSTAQRAAITNALSKRLTIVQGPPGTGKTHTSVRILKMWAKDMGYRPLLATSECNIAVDNIAEGLAKEGVKVIRIGRPEKVREILENVCLDNKVKLAAAERAKQRKESEGGDLSDLEELGDEPYDKESHEYAKWESLRNKWRKRKNWERKLDKFARTRYIEEADVICATTITAGSQALGGYKFHAILIDEVAQATEVSTLVPIICRGALQIALCGDHCQLPPSTLSQEAEMRGMSLSLYSRLVEAGVPFQFLDTQYRAHPNLMAFSAYCIYQGKLKNGIEGHQRPVPKGVPWPNPLNPAAFFECDCAESLNGESKDNLGEADTLLHLIEEVLKVGDLSMNDLGIVTPYKGQVRTLRTKIYGKFPEAQKSRDLEIASVDNFQGREKELIIFSAVRCNKIGSVGFLKDWRRLNVMITRARRGLVVVGNAATLVCDKHWRLWLKFTEEQGGCEPGTLEDAIKEAIENLGASGKRGMAEKIFADEIAAMEEAELEAARENGEQVTGKRKKPGKSKAEGKAAPSTPIDIALAKDSEEGAGKPAPTTPTEITLSAGPKKAAKKVPKKKAEVVEEPLPKNEEEWWDEEAAAEVGEAAPQTPPANAPKQSGESAKAAKRLKAGEALQAKKASAAPPPAAKVVLKPKGKRAAVKAATAPAAQQRSAGEGDESLAASEAFGDAAPQTPKSGEGGQKRASSDTEEREEKSSFWNLLMDGDSKPGPPTAKKVKA